MISGWTNVELQGKTRNYTITGLKSWIAYDVQVKFIASGGSSSESNPRPVRVVSYGMIIVYVQMHLYFIFLVFLSCRSPHKFTFSMGVSIIQKQSHNLILNEILSGLSYAIFAY